MSNPKLEFFRFSLKHKSGEPKTFRLFMSDLGKCTARQQDKTIFRNLYKYFMEQPLRDFATNDSIKKVLTLITNPKNKVINKHYDKRPQPLYPDCIISGVMNGEPYGKERIVTNLTKKDELGNLVQTQPVLQPYYIFVYLPLDHYEGFFMIHSDSADESITQAARHYIASLFNVGDYYKPSMKAFAPKKFWEEYKDGATISSMSFKTTVLDPQIEDDDPFKEILGEFDVNITLTPRGEAADLSLMQRIKDFFGTKVFGNPNYNQQLDEFEKCTVHTKNSDTNSTKTFDWNNRDQELLPTVYLKDRVAITEEGTPDFAALDMYCKQLFKDTILPELRPDLYVNRVD